MPPFLDLDYASRYSTKTPPWGFNDLGYVVYKRTYARPIYHGDELIRTEEWWETIHRVINGAQSIGADLTQDEMERLFDYMFNLKGSVGGRMLWQLGTENNFRLGADSLVNCLSGDTMVPTNEGAQRIDRLAEKGEAIVMTEYGKWVNAVVRQFGEQPTAAIYLRRGRQVKTVSATANHKWLKRGRAGREEVLTSELQPGDKLVSIKGQGTANVWMSPDGVRAGLVYGDGSVYDQGSVAFVAEKDRLELESFFFDYKATEVDGGVRFRNLPRSYKADPSLSEARGFLYGWLAGYFAADGYARNGKGAQINSTDKERLQTAKDVAVLLGVATGPMYSQTRTSNLTDEESTIWTLPLHVEDPEFFLLSKHRGDFLGRDSIRDWVVVSVGEYGEPQPVYCAVVPDTHTFALEDNLLTHNCWFTNLVTPEDFGWLFERLMLGGGVGFSVDRTDLLGVVRKGLVEHQNANDADFIVPDKREGWSELVVRTLRAYLGDRRDPTNFTYSTQLVRPAGVPIKTFGGTASGPQILVDGINDITNLLDKAIGRTLSPTEVLDIANIIGRVVVSGNVRRSAQIALGQPFDSEFLTAKRWSENDIPIWRAMSNNSVYVDSDAIEHLPEEFWKNYQVDENGHGISEAYGLFNLASSQKYGRTGEEREDLSISGTNPCVTADAWVMTGSGPRRVSELIGRPFEAMVDGKPYDATGFWKTATKDVYRLQTIDGYSVRLTDDHQVLTPSGWVEAGTLNAGDNIVLHDHFGNLGWGGDGSEDDGYVLGNLIGDGTFDQKNDRAFLSVWSSDSGSHTVKERIEQIVRSMPHRSDFKGWRRVSKSDQYRISTSAVRDLASSFGVTAKSKTITREIEQASSDFYKGFLRGLFDADGHIEGKSTEGGISVRLASINYQMLEAAQRMLARLGIRSRIHALHKGGTRDLPGGHYTTQDSWRLVITGEQAQRFMWEIGFTNADKAQKWEDLTETMQRGFYHKDSVATVFSITPDGHEDVYDCTVETVHAFDANGIYVHNCAEIGLAHRESCNLSEIFLPNVESKAELIDLAKILYKVQKAVAAMPYLDAGSDAITKRNMRLGLGMGGVAQAGEKLDWLSDTYEALREFDAEWSAVKGYPESVRLTTVKPSGCRPWDALTSTSSGLLTLEELFVDHVDGDEWCDIASDVKALQGETSSRISKTYDNGKSEVFSTRLTYGYELQSTGQHPWWVSRRYLGNQNGRYETVGEWVQTQDLQPGDILELVPGAYTSTIPSQLKTVDSRAIRMRGDATEIIQPKEMTSDLAWMLGYLWGDGAQSPGKYRFRWTDQNIDNLEKAQSVMSDTFGVYAQIRRASDGQKAHTLDIGSKMLWHWLIKNNVWKYFANELDLIPQVVRSSSHEHILAFLAGLIDADGHVAARKHENVIVLASAHARFARHVQDVALAVGVTFSRSHNTGEGNLQGDKSMWLMTLAPESSPERFAILEKNSVKMRQENKRAPHLPWPHDRRGRYRTRIFGKVESVESLGFDHTFDIEVEGTHWYYAGGVKSHNTVSLLAGVTPGVHPGFSRYHIRRVRMATNDPLVNYCAAKGYHVEPQRNRDGSEDPSTVVVEFPCEFPEGTIEAKDLSVFEQLDLVRRLQAEWADNAVSVTCYYTSDEVDGIKEYLEEHWPTMKSVSFLLKEDHGFDQAPLEQIGRDRYEGMLAKVNGGVQMDLLGVSTLLDGEECSAGACPIR